MFGYGFSKAYNSWSSWFSYHVTVNHPINFYFFYWSFVFRLLRLTVNLIEKINNDKHQIYSDAAAALKSILSKYWSLLIYSSFDWIGITPDQYHPLETEKQTHPCDDYCEKVLRDNFWFWGVFIPLASFSLVWRIYSWS
jgi:hypothetical protein